MSDLRSYQDLRAAAIKAERLLREEERFRVARKAKRSAASQGGESSSRPGKRQGYSAHASTFARGNSTGS